MNSIYKKAAVIVVLIITAVACTKQPSNLLTPELVDSIKFLSDSELKDIELVLNNNVTKHYDYRVIHVQKQQQGGHKLTVTKEDDMQGLLFMYDRKHLSPLGGAYYTDWQDNLLQFGDERKTFVMNFMANGQNILAIDGNTDGIIDTVTGNIDKDAFWIISDNILALLPCLSSSADDVYNAALDCTDTQTPGGTAGGSGGVGGPDDFGFNSGLLGEPDCSPRGPGGLVGGDNPETPPGEDPAPPPPPPSTESPDDENYPPMGRTETFTTEGDGRQTRVVTLRTSDKLIVQQSGETVDGSVIRTTIHRDSQGRETYREDVLVGPGPDRRLLMHRVNTTTYDDEGNPTSTLVTSRQARSGNSLPPVNPDGHTTFEDPRCAGRDTRASQGLGFLDLCAAQDSTDLLTCFKQLGSPLFNVTGGRCFVDSGPADGPALQCRNNESIAECIAGGGSPTECAENQRSKDIIGPDGEGTGPTDGPALPDNIGSLDIRYIDTIPLGAVLMGICRGGGCPDPRPF